jgi:xanthine dehydrogenase accessory factor
MKAITMTCDYLTDPLTVAAAWLAEGHRAAVATVLSTWGSAPRSAGSQMAIRDDGAFAGSVSAGCVEGAVIEAAQQALAANKPQRLGYGVTDSTAWAAGLTCGGRIEILVEPLTAETAAAWNGLRACGRSVVRAVEMESGRSHVFDPYADERALARLAREAARCDQSRQVEHDGTDWFLIVANPPVDLVVVGAVHIAQALARIAAPLGYGLRIIDPRGAFATAERFPGIALFHDYPDEVLAHAPLHPRSAVVALAHDPKIDDPALIAGLNSPAFYVGALGSQKTQALRRERLKAAGFSNGDLARLHGPVGLPIGSKTPEEIAVSIVADLIATVHKA